METLSIVPSAEAVSTTLSKHPTELKIAKPVVGHSGGAAARGVRVGVLAPFGDELLERRLLRAALWSRRDVTGGQWQDLVHLQAVRGHLPPTSDLHIFRSLSTRSFQVYIRFLNFGEFQRTRARVQWLSRTTLHRILAPSTPVYTHSQTPKRSILNRYCG